MKKIAIGIVCLMFAVAGVFGVARAPAKAVSASTPPVIPTGAWVRYTDSGRESANESRHMINHSATFTTLYNMQGYIIFDTEARAPVKGSVKVSIEVWLLRADGLHEEVIPAPDSFRENEGAVNEIEFEIWFWTFDTLGVYEISVYASIELYDDDSDGTDDDDDDEEEDIEPVIFRVNCKNAADPDFGISRADDGKIVAYPQNKNFFWDSATATYETSDEKLLESSDRKYMTWQGTVFGTQSITFTVTFVYIAEVDENGETVTGEPERTVPVTASIFISRAPRGVQWWEVLIGVGVLCALGGAVWFINRLSKKIEYQQK